MSNTVYPPLAGQDQQTSAAPTQPFAGQAPVITDTATSLAAIAQYEVCALTATGITPYVDATHTKDQMVVAANAASAASKVVSYYKSGHFNHAALTWPAEYDTEAKRKAFVNGTSIYIGHLLNNPVGA
jgi:hypothetical protein